MAGHSCAVSVLRPTLKPIRRFCCVFRNRRGGTCNPENFTDAEPIAEVTLSPFYIDVTEVTNRDYASCVAAEVCTPPNNTEFYADPAYGDHPAVYVTWAQATQYCDWAGKRLPTEAEWEKAARWDEAGNASYIFPWGDEFEAGPSELVCGRAGRNDCRASICAGLEPMGYSGHGGQRQRMGE